MPDFDIREYKTHLRNTYKKKRNELTQEEKSQKDRAIFLQLTETSAWKNANIIFTYISTAIEIDTWRLIEQAWTEHKKVAVPRCIENTRLMDFYLISSWNQVEPYSFGVLEPIPEKCQKIMPTNQSIMIVPGLSFDQDGFRLGYGKGYYDRYLSTYCKNSPKIGLCYKNCMRPKLYRNRYDVACNMIINENYTRLIPNT